MSTFKDLLDRLVVSFGSVPEEAEYNRSAILAAHQSELDLAAKEARIDELHTLISMNKTHVTARSAINDRLKQLTGEVPPLEIEELTKEEQK